MRMPRIGVKDTPRPVEYTRLQVIFDNLVTTEPWCKQLGAKQYMSQSWIVSGRHGGGGNISVMSDVGGWNRSGEGGGVTCDRSQ
jgi:hypothetical protein